MRTIDVEVKIHHETEKAYLVSSLTTGTKDWIPKELNGEQFEVDEGQRGFALITMPEWFAAEKGLI